MKRFLIVFLSLLLTQVAMAQKSYIQVTGEPDLSVFLDNQFKGKTTAEFNGYIIENVNPGTHRIKIVKQGYTPFEENVTVKAGEVFAYKVKPFVKQTVTISEYGNSGETVKQVEARKGKLVVQSVPIEIKITIPNIEGVKNAPKTKDEWVVNDIPIGRYDIEMSFGSKTIKKQIEISESDVTNVFVNMINGEFSSSIAMTPEKIIAKNNEYIKSVFKKYSVKNVTTLSEFYSSTPGSSILAQYKERDNSISISIPDRVILKNPSLTPGPRYIYYDRTKVKSYHHALKGFDDYSSAMKFYNEQVAEFKRNVDVKYTYATENDPKRSYYEGRVDGQRAGIGFQVNQVGKGPYYEVLITFGMY